MDALKDEFRSYLKAGGLKLTPERGLILEAAFSTDNHFEVEDLLIKLRQQGDRVSKATIYRTLPLLVKSGLLREVVFGERHSHYEHVFGHKHHDHLICLCCGKIIEFANPSIENLQDKICKEHGFEAMGHRFEITGYCNECQ